MSLIMNVNVCLDVPVTPAAPMNTAIATETREQISNCIVTVDSRSVMEC